MGVAGYHWDVAGYHEGVVGYHADAAGYQIGVAGYHGGVAGRYVLVADHHVYLMVVHSSLNRISAKLSAFFFALFGVGFSSVVASAGRLQLRVNQDVASVARVRWVI